MSELRFTTFIEASAAVCFDLMRDRRVQPNLVDQDRSNSNGLGRTFTFESRVLGFRTGMTVLVVEYDRARRFVDMMVDGYFHSFFHIHQFDDLDGSTRLTDTLIWEPPHGPIGKMVDLLFLRRHLARTVFRRNRLLKLVAEQGRA